MSSGTERNGSDPTSRELKARTQARKWNGRLGRVRLQDRRVLRTFGTRCDYVVGTVMRVV